MLQLYAQSQSIQQLLIHQTQRLSPATFIFHLYYILKSQKTRDSFSAYASIMQTSDLLKTKKTLNKLEIKDGSLGIEYFDSSSSSESSQSLEGDSQGNTNRSSCLKFRKSITAKTGGIVKHQARNRANSFMGPQYSENQFESIVKLYVIKLCGAGNTSSMLNESSRKNSSLNCNYFKMKIDPMRCQPETDNDQDLRLFKRLVRERFHFSEGFKQYNQLGHVIQDFEISLINQDEHGRGIVYVSPHNISFDFEMYLKMFQEINKLGEGGFGQVVLAKHIITKEKYAIKHIQPYIHKADEVSKMFKEALVLQKLHHPNVIKLYNVFQLPDNRIILFMEHIKGGSLSDYLKIHGPKVQESTAQKIMHEIISAINFCHQKSIVHRDIKLENIMLRKQNDLSHGLVIIDFGIAGQLQKVKEKQNEGTIRYAPPELASGKHLIADTQFDVWCLGILLYRLISGVFPFDGTTFSEIKQKILNQEVTFPEEHFYDISDTCIALIKLMLCKQAANRPRLYQLILHQWFQTSKHQQTLMNMTIFQNNQNTMMNFFKQELSNVEAVRRKQEEDQQNKQVVEKIENNEHHSQLQLSHRAVQQYFEQNVKTKKNRSSLKNNFSPTPKANNIRMQFGPEKFSIVPNRVGQGTADNKERAIESAMSLSIKKQKLNDMRSLKQPHQPEASIEREANTISVQESLDKLSSKMMLMKKRKRFESHQRNNINGSGMLETNNVLQNAINQRASALSQNNSKQQQITPQYNPTQAYIKQVSKFGQQAQQKSRIQQQRSIEEADQIELPMIGGQSKKNMKNPQIQNILHRIINHDEYDEYKEGSNSIMNIYDYSPSPKSKARKEPLQIESQDSKPQKMITGRQSPVLGPIVGAVSFSREGQFKPSAGSVSRLHHHHQMIGGMILDSMDLNQIKKKRKNKIGRAQQEFKISQISISKKTDKSNQETSPVGDQVYMRNQPSFSMAPQQINNQSEKKEVKVQVKII